MLAERVNRWIAEYKAEGKAEGRFEERVTILRRMKKTGMSIAEIAQITGLSEDEIKHMI
jgi:predicted transposase/invertase (TIGR01784 family)